MKEKDTSNLLKNEVNISSVEAEEPPPPYSTQQWTQPPQTETTQQPVHQTQATQGTILTVQVTEGMIQQAALKKIESQIMRFSVILGIGILKLIVGVVLLLTYANEDDEFVKNNPTHSKYYGIGIAIGGALLTIFGIYGIYKWLEKKRKIQKHISQAFQTLVSA